MNLREELETKFDGKLQKEMSGPEFELVSRIFKSVTTRKITVPGTFKSYVYISRSKLR